MKYEPETMWIMRVDAWTGERVMQKARICDGLFAAIRAGIVWPVTAEEMAKIKGRER